MLTKKIVSSSIAFALTASVALLAGCPTPVVGDASPSASGTASASPSGSASASASASSSASTTPSTSSSASTTPSTSGSASATPSASASATINTQPSGTTGTTSDVKELATFNGKVFDPNNVPVEGATVTAKSLDTGVTWVGEAQVTVGGAYVFRNAPAGARILITVTKDGWTTRTRSEVLKSNLQGDPNANVFHFGGAGAGDSIYAIQDEPEVTMVKVNGKQAFNAGAVTAANKPASDDNTGLSGLDPNLEIELTFSEPIKAADVRNFARIVSQNFSVKSNTNFTIDENLSGVTITTTDDKTFLIKTNKNVLQERTGNEARYRLEFSQAFRDKNDLAGFTGGTATQRLIRYSPAVAANSLVFSVKNDTEDPKIVSMQAQDGGSGADKIVITYSEPLEVINQASNAAGLVNPLDPSNTNHAVWAERKGTETLFVNGAGGANKGHSVTVVGFIDQAAGTAAAAANFKAVYEIAKIVPAGGITNNHRMIGLTAKGVADNDPTVLGNGAIAAANKGAGLTAASLKGNQVTLEFNAEAFNRDDRVILSVGRHINGRYSDTRVTPTIDISLNTTNNASFFSITDPSGRAMSTGNGTTSANVSIDDSQRVSTAS